ncbi:MAG: FAD-dependent oxidoreductase, partial [Solirubrobacteraceae bacterium]
MGAEERDVVVIGAGVAGLTAATRLAAAGVDVAVIEARDRVGGRVLTEDVGGLELELGGQWIAPYQHAVRAVIADLGLELFSRYREGEDVEVGADKAPVRVRHDAHDPAYEEAVEALEAVTRELDPDAPWEHPRAAELDAVPYAAWLREAIRDESAREALGFVATGFMTKPSQSFSLLQAAWLLSSAGEVRNLLDADLVLDARVVGGAQRIALGLAEGLGDRVRLGAPVRDVAWTEGGVDVHVPGGEISAARLIVAIPPNLTGTIRFDPPLPAWRMRAEQETSQGSLIKVQAAYDEPFWRADGLSGTGLGPGEPVSEIYDNSPPGGSP